MEFKEKCPTLWSLVSQSFSDLGFGTACIGVLYIPGKRSVPKLSEYLSALISMSLCSLRKSASRSVFRGQSEKSQVKGYSSFWVLAHGQNPSWREVQMDWTNSWFGCESNSSSNLEILIGVTILNRSGLSRTVEIASEFDKSTEEGHGRGLSVIVQQAVGLKDGEVSASVQTDCSKYFRHLGTSLFSTFSPSMSPLTTFVADVQPSAVLFCLVTFPIILFVAWFVPLPVLPSFSFLSTLIFGRPWDNRYPNWIHLCNLEVGKFLEIW